MQEEHLSICKEKPRMKLQSSNEMIMLVWKVNLKPYSLNIPHLDRKEIYNTSCGILCPLDPPLNVTLNF